MNCPECSSGFARVIDTRERHDFVTRRRKCDDCEYRFTTHERYVPKEEIAARRKRRGRALARKYNSRSKPRQPRTPEPKPVNVFLKARCWGLSVTDLSQAGMTLGLERGTVLEVIRDASDREAALRALAELGVIEAA